MSYKPQISVILSFRNQRDVVESTLSSLFDLQSVAFELFIIDDASTDGTGDAIQSLLDYYDHERTFFFQHREPAGRGNCLNEALQQVNTPFVWCPTSLEQVDENALGEAIEQASDSEVSFLVQQHKIPTTANDWLAYTRQQDWVPDDAFIWNLQNIAGRDHFFNPYQEHYTGVELAARLTLSASANFSETAQFSTPSSNEIAVSPRASEKRELLYNMLRYLKGDASPREEMIARLQELKSQEGGQEEIEHDLLAEARQMQEDGRFSSALELVEHVLDKHPQHPKAKQLKIQILEKKRRFVEASELKHEIDSEQKTQASSANIKTSIVIPTALHGKQVLEHCLIAISEHCEAETTELIVIDNASLDDTHDYLAELESKNFFNISVITNKQNRGFAASVNQGLEQARGEYALVMHNDVIPDSNLPKQLEDLMDSHPTYAVIGPMADKTLNPDQSVRNQEHYQSALVQTEYLDSFCMMIRLDTKLRMDEEFELSFFEDIDFCFQARQKGYKVGIAPQVSVEHHYGTTTFALNLDTDSEQYWKNVAYFNEKWGVEVYSEEELKSRSRFDQLLALDELVNPMFPEESIKEYFDSLFTDELKTEMMRSEHDPETLCKLVHLMMVMEQRDVMRRLEDRLDTIELPASLIYQLVRFYFNRNIYSRCLHYLDRLKAEQQSLQSELYKLEIMVQDKDLERAVPKLKELLEKAPSHPALYKLAGDIHQLEGDPEEAESFYEIAHQIDPFEYSETGEAEFKLKS